MVEADVPLDILITKGSNETELLYMCDNQAIYMKYLYRLLSTGTTQSKWLRRRFVFSYLAILAHGIAEPWTGEPPAHASSTNTKDDSHRGLGHDIGGVPYYTREDIWNIYSRREHITTVWHSGLNPNGGTLDHRGSEVLRWIHYGDRLIQLRQRVPIS